MPAQGFNRLNNFSSHVAFDNNIWRSAADYPTKELQTLENRRAEDNRKILQEIKRIATRPNPVPSPRVVTEKTKPSPPPYTGPVYEITIEPGYTISGIAQKYREQGHEISEEDIIRANPGIDPRRLKIGQVINVPAVP